MARRRDLAGTDLAGTIDAAFFDRKAADLRRELDSILRSIAIQQNADENCFEDGIQVLELASDAHPLFRQQIQPCRRVNTLTRKSTLRRKI